MRSHKRKYVYVIRKILGMSVNYQLSSIPDNIHTSYKIFFVDLYAHKQVMLNIPMQFYSKKTVLLKTPAQTELIAKELAKLIEAPAFIYLEGQLGAGKTTFVRGFLKGFAFEGR